VLLSISRLLELAITEGATHSQNHVREKAAKAQRRQKHFDEEKHGCVELSEATSISGL